MNSLRRTSGQLGGDDVAEVNLLLRRWSVFRLSSNDNGITRKDLK